MFERLFLSPDGIPAGAAPSGETAPAPTGTPDSTPSGQPATPAQGEPSFSYDYTFDDGRAYKFSSKKELDDFFRGGVLRRDHFDKNNQKLSEQRKAFEQKEKEIQAAFESVKALETKYKPINEFLEKRPEVMRELISRYKGTQPQAQEDPRWNEFAEFKKSYDEEKKKSEIASQRQQIYKAMAGRYSDFNEETINSALSRILDAAPGDEMASLVDLIYWAEKGRATPAQIEETIKANLEKKQGLKAPLTSGGATPAAKGGFSSIEEAAEAAKKRFS